MWLPPSTVMFSSEEYLQCVAPVRSVAGPAMASRTPLPFFLITVVCAPAPTRRIPAYPVEPLFNVSAVAGDPDGVSR